MSPTSFWPEEFRVKMANILLQKIALERFLPNCLILGNKNKSKQFVLNNSLFIKKNPEHSEKI